MISREAYMEHLLKCDITLEHVRRDIFESSFAASPETTRCGRLLHILSGQIRYVFENRSITLGSGAMLFVPTGVQREWTVAGNSPLNLEWFLYVTDPPDAPGMKPRISSQADEAMVRDAFARLLELSVLSRRIDQLAVASECKTLLTRFLHNSEPIDQHSGALRGSRSKVAVSQALKILHAEFDRTDLLTGLHRRVALSENYFRHMFRQAVGITLGEYLLRIRMRNARDLLASAATLTIKEVANRVGYGDPLYFSRVYRRFWGHPPSEERNVTV